jgi:hypothetical protein
MDDQQYKEGDVLTNPKTGQKIQLVNNEWKPYNENKVVTADGFTRGLRLGVRDLMSGAMGVPALAADVVTMPFAGAYNVGRSLYNKATGQTGGTVPLIGRTGQQFEQVLTAAGYPEAETPTERVLSAATRGVAGVGTGMGVGKAVESVATPVAKKLAEVLTSVPGRQVAIGAVSPASGQMVKEAGGGPVAQTVAELGTAAAMSAPGAISRVPQTATTDQLRAASGAAYKAAENAGAVFKPAAYDNFFASLASDVKKAGFDVGLHPKVSAVLTRLENEQGNPQTLENMEILRRVVKSAAASPEADERRIASLIQDKLDDFVSKAGPQDIMGGNAQVAVPALQEARKLWSQASKSDAIETLIDRAKLSAPNFSASGMENSLRTEFRALAKNERKMRLFTQDEQDAIRKVAMGGPIENAMRMIGKFAIRGPVSGGLSTGTGLMFGGPVGLVAFPAIGETGRFIASQMTKRNAEMAAALMRGGKLSKTTGMNPDQLAAALAAMEAANAGQQ